MILRPITVDDVGDLYELLKERTISQSISHVAMPTWNEHVAFIRSEPYKAWYIIQVDDEMKGSIYLSKQNEIGIFVFNKYAGQGYASLAIKMLMDKHEGPFLANINPMNSASRALFVKLGFKHIQETYKL